MKTFRLATPVLLILAVFLSCTRDDLCDPGTSVTPLLVINFRDNANPLQSKNVTNLTVRINNADSTFVFATSDPTDSIAIPLDTDRDASNLIFILNDDDNAETTNADNLEFTYQRTELYINRACGFKTTYANFSADVVDDTDNWITSFQVLQTEITNDNEAHLTIRF